MRITYDGPIPGPKQVYNCPAGRLVSHLIAWVDTDTAQAQWRTGQFTYTIIQHDKIMWLPDQMLILIDPLDPEELKDTHDERVAQ